MGSHQEDRRHSLGTDAAEHLLARAADSMPEAMLTLDSGGTVTSANRVACELLGRDPGELVGRSAHSIAHRRDVDHGEAECMLGAAAHPRVDPADDLFVRGDGASFDVSYTCAALDLDDGPPGSVLVFRDVTEGKARRRHELEELNDFAWVLRIREALEQGGFELHEQPLVELSNGGIARHELLLRLADDGDPAKPADFLGIAERYGLAGEIDSWVVTEAVRRAAAGRAVNVNLSAKSISPEFVEFVERELTAAGADPSLVVFELTEDQLLADEVAGSAFARGLRRIGCGVAVDDFGTGSSGLRQFKDLPADYLKIDVEFIRDLSRHPENRHVVEAIVKLAKGFGRATVAEGVEDLATLQILDELGVDFAQGYALGRPAAPVTESRAA
jgi:PAS domain S-box-containing protein